eukprot:15215121-Alexandrium_andersonii.AAC.1
MDVVPGEVLTGSSFLSGGAAERLAEYRRLREASLREHVKKAFLGQSDWQLSPPSDNDPEVCDM